MLQEIKWQEMTFLYASHVDLSKGYYGSDASMEYIGFHVNIVAVVFLSVTTK